MCRIVGVILSLVAAPLLAQQTDWSFRTRIELRANYRDSNAAQFPLRFPFPPSFLPVGQTVGFEQTVDPGSHGELSVAQVRLDASYGTVFTAHAQLHAVDLYRRNPTSKDRKIDADELYLRFGPKPDFLDRPARTSIFVQMGKFPKMERQPIRLLESYGLAATAFNRFEDVGFMAGGSIGRNLYWRLQATSGNPLYFRDPNALAGDNGIKGAAAESQFQAEIRIPDSLQHGDGRLLPKTEHMQFEGIGIAGRTKRRRWALTRSRFIPAPTSSKIASTGTFYGIDIDLLNDLPASSPAAARR
jgi:hypothetical protein